jgi:hypothetical protein
MQMTVCCEEEGEERWRRLPRWVSSYPQQRCWRASFAFFVCFFIIIISTLFLFFLRKRTEKKILVCTFATPPLFSRKIGNSEIKKKKKYIFVPSAKLRYVQ